MDTRFFFHPSRQICITTMQSAVFALMLLCSFVPATAQVQDGSIIVWGQNDCGQGNVPAPNTGFVAISGGNKHSLGLMSDSTIVAWGYNGYGQCNVPPPNVGFVAIDAGYGHSLGLKADGMIVVWGRNDYGQCDVPSPDSKFVSVAAGYYHSLALRGLEAGNGACCLYDSCEIFDPEECAMHGGTYQGDGTLCVPNPCPTSAVDFGPWNSAAQQVFSIPNPSTGDLLFEYRLQAPAVVTLKIYDASGALVRLLADGVQTTGSHRVPWDGRGASGNVLPRGVYLMRIETEAGTATGKVILAR